MDRRLLLLIAPLAGGWYALVAMFKTSAAPPALTSRAFCASSGLCTILLAGQAFAAPAIRTYTDPQGVVHVTNLHGGHKPSASHGRTSGKGALVPMVLLDAVVAESADLYNLPPALVKAVIATESNFNPWAVSEKGAIGLMQLMPETAREMFVDDPFDPVQNIQGGARYLRVLVNLFDGDLVKVISAYNAGPEVVKRSQARHAEFVVPAIPETQDYVRRVLRNYEALKPSIGGGAVDSSELREAEASKERS